MVLLVRLVVVEDVGPVRPESRLGEPGIAMELTVSAVVVEASLPGGIATVIYGKTVLQKILSSGGPIVASNHLCKDCSDEVNTSWMSVQ